MPTVKDDTLPFDKLEALGNDFVLMDARVLDFSPDADQVRQWADRRRGIGCDQLLILRSSPDPGHYCRIEIRNADGSEAEQCGNGMRAVALWLALKEGAGPALSLSTAAGTVETDYRSDDEISATLGAPDFSPAAVGLSGDEPFPRRFTIGTEQLDVYGASLGNPHLLVLESARADQARLERIGGALGVHPALARGANVGLAFIESSRRVYLRVHERGVGPTLACGSGASAAAAILLGLGHVENPVEVVQPGGALVVNWPGKGQPVNTTGPARHVFSGVIRCQTKTA